ncbi:MAG: thiolase family protein, partial [Candidatus Bathyarchaeia archaeon]
MREAFIVDGVRTPIGRYGGALSSVRPDDMAALIIRQLLQRVGVAPPLIDDVIFGCTNQAGEDNRNVARMALLLAGLPYTVTGVTVNRLCGSGLEAVYNAAKGVWSNEGDLYIAGGVESMSRAPYVMGKNSQAFQRGPLKLEDTTIGWRLVNPAWSTDYPPISLGETAENLAEKYDISRQEQDEFALMSHRKACGTIAGGGFKKEISPVHIQAAKGEQSVVEIDEHPRADTNLEKLSKLKPAFKPGGTVTAGNSSGINDGAAALLIASKEKCEALDLKPKARIVSCGVAGVHPCYMGIGPAPATKKALEKAQLTLGDMDCVELNEAFAAQVLACLREMEIDRAKLNPR